MKIKITNKEKIEKVLVVANNNSTLRCKNYDDVVGLAADAEKKLNDLSIPMQIRSGACMIDGFEKFPSAYKFNPTGTIIELQRGSNSWYLVCAEREYCDRAESNNGLKLNEKQRDYLKKQIDKKWKK